MKVTVVVCTYSFERLPDVLQVVSSLINQTHKEKEIIVSIDRNESLYSKLKVTLPISVRVVLSIGSCGGNSEARNTGIKHATGDVIAFVDDDAIPYPNWMEELVSTYEEDENLGGVAGEIIPLWINCSGKWFPKELWWIISCSYTGMPTIKQEVRNGFGTNMSFRKEIFEDVGLFNTNLGKKGEKWVVSDEAELCIRLRKKTGKKIIYNPDAKVKHKVYPYRLKIGNIVKRAFYDGYSKALLKSISKSDVLSTEKSFLKQLLFKFYPRSFKKIRFKPTKTLKALFLVTLVMMIEGSGYLSFYIKNIGARVPITAS